MVKIIDHDKKNTAILICEKLERNNYIQKFEINEKNGKSIYGSTIGRYKLKS